MNLELLAIGILGVVIAALGGTIAILSFVAHRRMDSPVMLYVSEGFALPPWDRQPSSDRLPHLE